MLETDPVLLDLTALEIGTFDECQEVFEYLRALWSLSAEEYNNPEKLKTLSEQLKSEKFKLKELEILNIGKKFYGKISKRFDRAFLFLGEEKLPEGVHDLSDFVERLEKIFHRSRNLLPIGFIPKHGVTLSRKLQGPDFRLKYLAFLDGLEEARKTKSGSKEFMENVEFITKDLGIKEKRSFFDIIDVETLGGWEEI